MTTPVIFMAGIAKTQRMSVIERSLGIAKEAPPCSIKVALRRPTGSSL